MKAGRKRGRTAVLATATQGRAVERGSTTARRGAQRLVGSLPLARRRADSLTRAQPPVIAFRAGTLPRRFRVRLQKGRIPKNRRTSERTSSKPGAETDGAG